MKTVKKAIKLLAIIGVAVIMCVNANVYAAELSETEPLRVADGDVGLTQIMGAGRSFINEGKIKSDPDGYNEFALKLAPIGSILAGVGIVIFAVVLGIMAIKWIVAKPEDKAKLKQAFVGYVIAAIVFFGAVGIWNIAIGIMNNIEGQL